MVQKLIWNDPSSHAPNVRLLPPVPIGVEQATVEAADSTVDHSDIRGSAR